MFLLNCLLNKIHFSYKLILTKPPPRLTSNEREWFFLHMFPALSCKIIVDRGQHIFTSERKVISNPFPVTWLLWVYFRFLTPGFSNNLNYHNILNNSHSYRGKKRFSEIEYTVLALCVAAIPSSWVLSRSYSEKRISAFGKPAWVSTNNHTRISFVSRVQSYFLIITLSASRLLIFFSKTQFLKLYTTVRILELQKKR